MTTATKEKRRKRTAKVRATPSNKLPDAPAHETCEASPKLTPTEKLPRAKPRTAKCVLTPNPDVPSNDNCVGEGQSRHDIHPAFATPYAQLSELNVHRRTAIRAIIRIDNATEALIRRSLGWRADMDEKARTKLNKQAADMRTAIEKGQSESDTHIMFASSLAPFVISAAHARQPFELYRNSMTKQMEAIAKTLPIFEWWNATNGCAALGLAIILAETGDLKNYANPAKVWKRLGLHVFNGKAPSTWRSAGGLSSEQWIEVGYSPARRSAMFTIGDPLIKHKNQYRDVYLARKEYEVKRDPEMTKMKAHRRAQRYMEKRIIRDLWRAAQSCK